jgi:choline dehydrogenase-like flavoprotein
MEIDLQNVPHGTDPVRAQVCIVGGGIAGIVLAHRLASRGVQVALLEAGGHTSGGEITIAEQPSGSLHHGIAEGQSRVLGGTSLRWGGQLLPLLDTRGWPIDPAALDPFYTQAEALLGVDHLPFEADRFFLKARQTSPALLSGISEIDGWLSKWTPFARRNLAQTLGRGLLRSPHVHVYLRAQVTELLPSADGAHIEAAIVRSPNGDKFRFQSAQFVLAGGTVETVRLMLASRSHSPAGVGNQHDQVGRNFHDHLTLPAATLTGEARTRALIELAPWIVRSRGHSATLHSAKLVASAALCARLGIEPVLAHLTLEEPDGEGVAAIRALLRARQGKGLPLAILRNAGRLPGAAVQAIRLASAMVLQGRRYVSPQAEIKLYLNAAQCAGQDQVPAASRITLSDQLDPAGMPLAHVDWRIAPCEVRTLRRFAAWLRDYLAPQGIHGIHWDPALFASDDTPLPTLDDARHAMGGACMGTDSRTSVVDPDLRVHGLDNLHLASAATFPTGAAHLPTLPLIALTLRLADRLARL